MNQYMGGRVFPMLARVAGVATACKMLCLILVGLALVALLVRTAVKRIAPKAGAARARPVRRRPPLQDRSGCPSRPRTVRSHRRLPVRSILATLDIAGSPGARRGLA